MDTPSKTEKYVLFPSDLLLEVSTSWVKSYLARLDNIATQRARSC